MDQPGKDSVGQVSQEEETMCPKTRYGECCMGLRNTEKRVVQVQGGKEGTEAAGKAGRGRPGGAWSAVALDLDFFPTLNGKSLKGFKMGCNTEQFTF